MKFACINDFINYKNKCPFCNAKLIVNINSRSNVQLEKITLDINNIFFKFNANYPYDHSPSKEFDLTIALKSKKIKYVWFGTNKTKFPEFLNIFNASQFYISLSCNKKCKNDYVIALVSLIANGDGLSNPVVSFERFETEKYICTNNYIKKQLAIQLKDTDKKSIITDFYELDKENIVNVENRINTFVLFS